MLGLIVWALLIIFLCLCVMPLPMALFLALAGALVSIVSFKQFKI